MPFISLANVLQDLSSSAQAAQCIYCAAVAAVSFYHTIVDYLPPAAIPTPQGPFSRYFP